MSDRFFMLFCVSAAVALTALFVGNVLLETLNSSDMEALTPAFVVLTGVFAVLGLCSLVAGIVTKRLEVRDNVTPPE